MALIIPTASSTWGDSSTTEGPFRKYVLAQFRGDADLEWVRELRGTLIRDELKWRDVRPRRPHLRKDKALWAKVEKGIGQATVVVIDPEPVQMQIAVHLLEHDAPLSSLAPDVLADLSSSAIINGTPIAYLPFELAQAVPWDGYDPVASIDAFTPDHIRSELGPSLKQAQIFAARAHAAFDLPSIEPDAVSTLEIFKSPIASVVLEELLETTRLYDTESPQTLGTLNRAAIEIARALGRDDVVLGRLGETPLIREVDSRGIDHLQGADIAAGWAREMLETGPAKVLGSVFERVWVNGRRIK